MLQIKKKKSVSIKPKRRMTYAEQKQIAAAIERAKGNPKEVSAQQSIPYQRMYPDGICRLTDTFHTKTVQFQDINYQLAQNDDKTAIFEGWCDFLNYFARLLFKAMSQNESATMRQITSRQREIETRLAAIASNIKHLYEDKCAGKIPEDIFQSLLTDYTDEQKELTVKLERNRHALEEQQCTERDIADWLNLIAGYMELKTLDRITVMELIESIEVGERKRDNGRHEQEISIRYRFIGDLLDNAKEDIA